MTLVERPQGTKDRAGSVFGHVLWLATALRHMPSALLTQPRLVQVASLRQAAAASERPLYQHAVAVPLELPADAQALPDPRPYAAVARTKPNGAASPPRGTSLHVLEACRVSSTVR